MKAAFSFNQTYPTAFVAIFCPGCRRQHVIIVEHVPGHTDSPGHGPWQWNKSLNNPTFSPSLLVRTGKYANPGWFAALPPDQQQLHEPHSVICHSFIREGRIEFLADSTHDMAGQCVDLPDYFD